MLANNLCHEALLEGKCLAGLLRPLGLLPFFGSRGSDAFMGLNRLGQPQRALLTGQQPPGVALLAEDDRIVRLPRFSQVIQQLHSLGDTILASLADVKLP